MFGSKYLPATPEERKTMQEFRNRYGQRDLNLAIRLAFQLPPRGQEMIAKKVQKTAFQTLDISVWSARLVLSSLKFVPRLARENPPLSRYPLVCKSLSRLTANSKGRLQYGNQSTA